MIGLARKAGKLAVGSDAVETAVRNGKAVLVLLAADASAGTKKRIGDKCASYGVALQTTEYTRERLGAAVGKDPAACAAFLDASFATAFNGAGGKVKSGFTEAENSSGTDIGVLVNAISDRKE